MSPARWYGAARTGPGRIGAPCAGAGSPAWAARVLGPRSLTSMAPQRSDRRGVVLNMKISRPQPATIISIVALVMASTGSAVAAVSFARNAGAVDGKSAAGSGTTLSHAAGKLI